MDVTIAVFDVDGTLTVRDCVVPFTRTAVGTFGIFTAMLRQSKSVFTALISRDRDVIKSVLVKVAYTGLDAQKLEQQGISFADKVYSSWMRQDVARRYRWHQEQGHVVVLVSASLDTYLDPLGDLLEADAVLCSRLEVIDGVLTGRLDGPNCRGQEKVSRITQWCQESQIPFEAIEYAYGDSRGDLEMLAMASHSFYVAKDEIDIAPQ